MLHKRGFTIIELLVVIAIIAILFGVVRPMLSSSSAKAREYECESHLQQLGMAIQAYAEDYGVFPKDLNAVHNVLRDRKLLICPATSENYHYQAPGVNVDPDKIVLSCIDMESTKKRPHKGSTSCLMLTAGGKVVKIRNTQ